MVLLCRLGIMLEVLDLSFDFFFNVVLEFCVNFLDFGLWCCYLNGGFWV